MKKIQNLTLLSAVIVLSIAPLIFSGCSGDEVISVDNTPPPPAVLIPHLGDTGDEIYIAGSLLNDSNNGLDTLPDGNFMRLQWDTITGANLDYAKIYRYGDYTALTLVDSLPRSAVVTNEYLDTNVGQQPNVYQMWNYYVELYSKNGQHSVSDTVSYKLLPEPELISPSNNAQIASSEDLVFRWMETGDVIHYRILLFDSDHDYIWHQDYYIVEDGDFSFTYNGPPLEDYNDIAFIWRIDSFGDLYTEDGVSLSGSESRERFFFLGQ
jgi:hypothetical protein